MLRHAAHKGPKLCLIRGGLQINPLRLAAFFVLRLITLSRRFKCMSRKLLSNDNFLMYSSRSRTPASTQASDYMFSPPDLASSQFHATLEMKYVMLELEPMELYL